jgi:ABC-type antimicrobial peptide transport system permease subunit
VRFFRHAITAVGILLGVAFFAAMLTLREAERHAAVPDAGAASRALWLAATSLLMCFVGVTNSMLMSVTERYREIGTIKCLGAPDGFIVKVFVLEALLIGSIGSLAGAALGSLAMFGATSAGGLQAGASEVVRSGLVAAAAGIVMALVAAVAPAIQAARMPAAAALRVEV